MRGGVVKSRSRLLLLAPHEMTEQGVSCRTESEPVWHTLQNFKPEYRCLAAVWALASAYCLWWVCYSSSAQFVQSPAGDSGLTSSIYMSVRASRSGDEHLCRDLCAKLGVVKWHRKLFFWNGSKNLKYVLIVKRFTKSVRQNMCMCICFWK